MKKNLAHLTGILLLIAILATGSVIPAEDEPTKKVTIYVKAVEGRHLEMYEEDDEGNVTSPVIDMLTTGVDPTTKVVWRRAPDSGIKRFIKVDPVDLGKPIFPEPATTFLFGKRYRHHVPEDAPDPSAKEKYIIKVRDKDNNEWEIDPHLIIPRPQ